MRPRALAIELEPRDFTRLRSYSASCARNGLPAAATAPLPEKPDTTATVAIISTSDRASRGEIRNERAMSFSSAGNRRIIHRPIAPQLGRFTKKYELAARIARFFGVRRK